MSVLKQYNSGTGQWEAVLVGKQGPSGTIAVNAPITNSGTANAAVLGVDYSALQYGQNMVINGAFDIWQRGTSVAVTAGNLLYTADRWVAYRGSAVAGLTISRQLSGLAGFQYCARVQRDSGNTSTERIEMHQDLETINSVQFAGKTVTVSFYARAGANYSNPNSQVELALIYGTGTDQSIRGGYTGQTVLFDQYPVISTSWQRFSYTATVPTTATQLGLKFQQPAVTGTAGAADYFEVTGIQLEAGSVATPFKRAGGTIAGELAACQRYYRKSYSLNTYPGAATVDGCVMGSWSGAANTSAKGVKITFDRMRATPTVKVWDGTGNADKITINVSLGSDVNNITPGGIYTITDTGAFIYYGGATNGVALMCHYTAEAEL